MSTHSPPLHQSLHIIGGTSSTSLASSNFSNRAKDQAINYGNHYTATGTIRAGGGQVLATH